MYKYFMVEVIDLCLHKYSVKRNVPDLLCKTKGKWLEIGMSHFHYAFNNDCYFLPQHSLLLVIRFYFLQQQGKKKKTGRAPLIFFWFSLPYGTITILHGQLKKDRISRKTLPEGFFRLAHSATDNLTKSHNGHVNFKLRSISDLR